MGKGKFVMHHNKDGEIEVAVVVKAAQVAGEWTLVVHAFKPCPDDSRVFIFNSLYTVHQNLLDMTGFIAVPLSTAQVMPFTGVVIQYESAGCVSLVPDL